MKYLLITIALTLFACEKTKTQKLSFEEVRQGADFCKEQGFGYTINRTYSRSIIKNKIIESLTCNTNERIK